MLIPFFGIGIRSDAQDFSRYQQELYRINKAYDSSVFLSFNVRYLYSTDTVDGKSKNTELGGEYTLNGNKAYYRIGNIEYLKNDSFAIAAYNDDRFLMVTKGGATKNRSSSSLPIKSIVDSMFLGMYSHYTVTIKGKSGKGSSDSTRQIRFVKIPGDSLALYDDLALSYFSKSHILKSLEYGYRQYVDRGEGDTATVLKKWRVRFTILFDNYHVETLDPNIFSESRFITQETMAKWQPVEKYRGYKVYMSNQGRK